jgi:hypothetical protein
MATTAGVLVAGLLPALKVSDRVECVGTDAVATDDPTSTK